MDAPHLPVRPIGRAASAVAVVTSAVVAGATFLPWRYTEIVGSGTRAVNGWTALASTTMWGPLLVLSAAITAGCAAPATVGVHVRAGINLGVAAAGITAAVSVLPLVDVLTTVLDGGGRVDTAIGTIVLIGSAAAAFAASVVVAVTMRPAKVSAPRAVGAVG